MMKIFLPGLQCSQTFKQVTLKSISNEVTICDTVALVRSSLLYHNEENVAIEAQFVFPMDDDSAVYHFEAEINGKRIIGECQEREQAKESYQEAVSQGHSAFLLAEDDTAGDIFCMNLGCLPPHTLATIKLAYVVKLSFDEEGAVQFVLPTVLNPRYTPKEAASSQSTVSTTAHGGANKMVCDFQFKAEINSRLQVKDVISKSAPILWQRENGGNIIHVTLPQLFQIKSDLDLRVVYADPHKSTLTLERGAAGQAGILQKDVLMLNFFPDIDTSITVTNAEFIFLVDRSGSMSGNNIDQAKATLLLFLKSLPVGCFFNIVSFGSNFDVLFPESQEYNEATMQQAISLQESMSANMGGTEIMKPLEHIYQNLKMKEGYSRQLFLLTDGMVSNSRAVINLVKTHASLARLFSFGIGAGVSTSLVKGIARAGKGKAEFVSGSERLQPKVISCLKLATQPSVTSLSLEWSVPDGIAVMTIPENLPILFAGEHLVVYGIVSKKSKGSTCSGLSATLRAKIGDQTREEKVSLSEDTLCTSADLALHRIAAKTQIKQLELTENQMTENPTSPAKQKILLLSLASNTVSKYTAFFGVDVTTKERVHRQHGTPLWSTPGTPLWSTPGIMPGRKNLGRRRGGFQSLGMGSNHKLLGHPDRSRQQSDSSPTKMMKFKKVSVLSNHIASQSCMEMNAPPPGMSMRKCRTTSSRPTRHPETRDVHECVISLQRFDGSWELREDLTTLLKLCFETLKAKCPVKNDSLWATILIVVWLQRKCQDKKDEWELIVSKAKSWLQRQSIELPHTLESLAEEAKTCF